MNLRHAAALTLLGWYLVYPPGRLEPDTKAPLREWIAAESFDSAGACEAKRTKAQQIMRDDPGQIERQLRGMKSEDAKMYPPAETVKLRIKSGKCIASDDPRLKGK